jgi:hypothetical protein
MSSEAAAVEVVAPVKVEDAVAAPASPIAVDSTAAPAAVDAPVAESKEDASAPAASTPAKKGGRARKSVLVSDSPAVVKAEGDADAVGETVAPTTPAAAAGTVSQRGRERKSVTAFVPSSPVSRSSRHASRRGAHHIARGRRRSARTCTTADEAPLHLVARPLFLLHILLL